MTDRLALSAPWPTTITTDLPLSWLAEIEVDARRVLWTSDHETGRAWRGPAFNVAEARLLCAAAELGVLGALSFRALLAGLRGMARPLTWSALAGASEALPEDAGRLCLGVVLDRLGATLVRLDVVERAAADDERRRNCEAARVVAVTLQEAEGPDAPLRWSCDCGTHARSTGQERPGPTRTGAGSRGAGEGVRRARGRSAGGGR